MNNTLNEGMWEKTKYIFSKLGRYKADGKITGKSKTDAMYLQKMNDIINKKGNEVIKALDTKIKTDNPKFPNSESNAKFLQTILEISTVYDTIIASTNKDINDPQYIPKQVADGVIADLREYVRKFLDVDLASVYSVLDEIYGNDNELSETELMELDESFNFNEDVNSDTRTALKTKNRGNFKSTRIDTLKSNKLPLILAAIGTSLKGLEWIANSEWFKDFLTKIFGGDTQITTPDIVNQISGGKPDAEGFLHWAGQIDGQELKSGADVQSFIDKYGADNVKHMFDGNGGGDVNDQISKLQQLVSGDNANKSVGEIFNKTNQTYGDMHEGRNIFGISKAASFLANVIVKKGITSIVKGGATAVGAKITGLTSILAPIGIGFLVSGLLVKAMRMKGTRQSRAATLNLLYQSIVDVDSSNVGGANANTGGNMGTNTNTTNPTTSTGTTGATGVTGALNDDLYNSLLNLFRFIVNSDKKFGAGPTGTPINFKTGDKVEYRGNVVTVTVPNISNGKTQVYDGSSKFAVDNSELKPSTIPEGVLSEEELYEQKYFKDPELVKFLNKTVSPNRVIEFENLLNRVEQLRNKIRNIRDTGNSVFDGHIKKIKSNPIILTDFIKMFNISSTNPQAYENLKIFINDIFNSIYNGSYKNSTLISKLSTMGKVIPEAQAQRNQFDIDAQSRKKFKKHLLLFLSDTVALFQYMFSERKKLKNNSNTQQQNNKRQKNKLGSP